MADLIPYLTFRHGEQSLRFLEDGLGFERIAFQPAESGHVGHAELLKGDVVVMGGSGTAEPGLSPGLYLYVDDVDAVFERAVEAGAETVHGPEDTEWGTRRARIRDLDGHEWSFGNYRPGTGWD